MALITCPECGAQISDSAAACIHCGYPISPVAASPLDAPETAEMTEDIKKSPSFKGKSILSKYKTLIFAIVGIAIVCIAFLVIKANHFSNEEKHALNLVEKYQNMLKDPGSLVLRSDIVVISAFDDGNIPTEYVYFTASGNNSYGAAVTSTACFVEGKYICATKDIPSTSELLDVDQDEALRYLHIKLHLSQWNLYGDAAAESVEDVYKSYSVDAAKIARKLHVKSDID